MSRIDELLDNLQVAADSFNRIPQAAIDVLSERHRQVAVEGFDERHDDRHDRGELARAAVSYATHSIVVAELLADGMPPEKIVAASMNAGVPRTWPWDRIWWKPQDPRRNLVRAAALIIAEIERLDRAEARKAGQK